MLDTYGVELTHGGCMQVLRNLSNPGKPKFNATAAAAGICLAADPGDRGIECIDSVRDAIEEAIEDLLD